MICHLKKKIFVLSHLGTKCEVLCLWDQLNIHGDFYIDPKWVIYLTIYVNMVIVES